jgi:MFS family permease
LQLWQIYALAGLSGALSPATGAGVRVIVPHLVPEGALERANTLASTSLQFASLLGPALAGILGASVGGAFALLIDAMSFLFSLRQGSNEHNNCSSDEVVVVPLPLLSASKLASSYKKKWTS